MGKQTRIRRACCIEKHAPSPGATELRSCGWRWSRIAMQQLTSSKLLALGLPACMQQGGKQQQRMAACAQGGTPSEGFDQQDRGLVAYLCAPAVTTYYWQARRSVVEGGQHACARCRILAGNGFACKQQLPPPFCTPGQVFVKFGSVFSAWKSWYWGC
eukprot:338558-Pelagomonas_calceolata.AAC.3